MTVTLPEPAIVISLLALTVAAASFGWNVWKDALRRPRFIVSLSQMTIQAPGMKPDGPYICLQALNLGPGANSVKAVYLLRPWYYRPKDGKTHRAAVVPYFAHQYNTKAGTKIDAGDTATYLFPYDERCFLSEGFSRIAISDGYNRYQFAPRRDMRRMKAQWNKQFG